MMVKCKTTRISKCDYLSRINEGSHVTCIGCRWNCIGEGDRDQIRSDGKGLYP